MEKKIDEFKKFVAEQLMDYDDFREASPEGYVDDITDMAVKLFAIPVVRLQYPLSSAHEMWQTARGMEHSEFVKYYNELIKGIQS